MTEIYPFHRLDFLELLARSVGGKLLYDGNIPFVRKGLLLRRIHSLPFGFYGSFRNEVDYDYLKFLRKRYVRIAISDFNLKIDTENISGYRSEHVRTYVYVHGVSKISKKRRRSLSNTFNKVKRYGISYSISNEHLADFYTLYVKHSRERKLRVWKFESIVVLKPFLKLLNVFKGNEYLGGLLMIVLDNYCLYWLMGWKRYENFNTSEYMFKLGIDICYEMDVRYVDFGASFTQGVSSFKSSFGAMEHTYRFIWSYPL